MTGHSKKLPSGRKKPKPPEQDEKHREELLDEALKQTFPASDPPAMLEPVPDSPPADENKDK